MLLQRWSNRTCHLSMKNSQIVSLSPGFSDLFYLQHGGPACGLWWHTLGWILLASQSGSTDDRWGHDPAHPSLPGHRRRLAQGATGLCSHRQLHAGNRPLAIGYFFWVEYNVFQLYISIGVQRSSGYLWTKTWTSHPSLPGCAKKQYLLNRVELRTAHFHMTICHKIDIASALIKPEAVRPSDSSSWSLKAALPGSSGFEQLMDEAPTIFGWGKGKKRPDICDIASLTANMYKYDSFANSIWLYLTHAFLKQTGHLLAALGWAADGAWPNCCAACPNMFAFEDMI